ncbi:hypothetical protein [Deinococcus marmoris]|uniref:hypothetical protein n=1 Tax=Deinococcus marmoris TaxID=249408 RepID=UPI0039EFEE5A
MPAAGSSTGGVVLGGGVGGVVTGGDVPGGGVTGGVGTVVQADSNRTVRPRRPIFETITNLQVFSTGQLDVDSVLNGIFAVWAFDRSLKRQ